MNFLAKVSDFIREEWKHKAPENTVLILPTRRSAQLLKKMLAPFLPKGIPLPHIFTTEDFFLRCSGLQPAGRWEAFNILNSIIQKYFSELTSDIRTYHQTLHKILNDFDEIHRSLAPASLLFKNLKALREIENWSLSHEPLTQKQEEYLHLMRALGEVYDEFYLTLERLGKNVGSFHYRITAEHPERIEAHFPHCTFYVIGLNALNGCEEKIYYDLERDGRLIFLFDADTGLMSDEIQEYGLFLRKHKSSLKKTKFLWEENHFDADERTIHALEVPGLMEEVAEGVAFLERALKQTPTRRAALVVSNEKLWPLLIPCLPFHEKNINVSAEIPLRHLHGYACLHALAESIYASRTGKLYYASEGTTLFKSLANSVSFREVLGSAANDIQIPAVIYDLKNTFQKTEWIPDFIKDENIDAQDTLMHLIELLLKISEKEKNSTSADIYQFAAQECHSILLEWKQHAPIDFPEAWAWFLNQLREWKIPLRSDSNAPVQVIGFLESRCLDFEEVMVLGVQEGVLPSGARTDSFLPVELKRHFKIPVYSDRDAVFAYHFFRLLQRPQNIFLVYSKGHFDGYQNASRFLKQIQMEWPLIGKKPQVRFQQKKTTAQTVPKNHIHWNLSGEEAEKFKHWAVHSKGISFSVLLDWKRCSYKHYLKKIARVPLPEEQTEYAEAADFGDILHKTLQSLYSPALNSLEVLGNLSNAQIHSTLNDVFKQHFPYESLNQGLLSIQFDLAFKIICQRVKQDAEDMKLSNLTKILCLEKEVSKTVTVNGNKINFFGIIDRIDLYKGTIRILDYKTGIKETDIFQVDAWDPKFWENHKAQKMIQLLFYIWLYAKENMSNSPIRAGILPLNFHHSYTRYVQFGGSETLSSNHAVMDAFEKEIINFITEFFDAPSIRQTENENLCTFCDYITYCYQE